MDGQMPVFMFPGGEPEGGKQQQLSAIGASMDYFLEDCLLRNPKMAIRDFMGLKK